MTISTIPHDPRNQGSGGWQLEKLRLRERLTWALSLNPLPSPPCPTFWDPGTPWEAGAHPHWALSPACRSQESLQNGEEAESFENEAEVSLSVPSPGLHSFLLAVTSSSSTHCHPQLPPFLSWAFPLGLPPLRALLSISPSYDSSNHFSLETENILKKFTGPQVHRIDEMYFS